VDPNKDKSKQPPVDPNKDKSKPPPVDPNKDKKPDPVKVVKIGPPPIEIKPDPLFTPPKPRLKPRPPQPLRMPLPPDQEIQKAVKSIYDRYRNIYDRKEPKEWVVLARNLLQLGLKSTDPNLKYALLLQAADLSSRGGDLRLAMQTRDE